MAERSRWWANRVVSPARAVGGRLTVTDDALKFHPHWFDRRVGADDWERPLRDVVEVGIADRDSSKALGGGLRRRLEIRFADGSVEQFVINRLERRAELIRQRLPSSDG